METKELLSQSVQSALCFAARYAYDRQTAGAYTVVLALKSCWHQIGTDGFHAGAIRNAMISACRLVGCKITLA